VHLAKRATAGPKVATKVAKPAGIAHLKRPASANRTTAAEVVG
jgi:hypothetical protein